MTMNPRIQPQVEIIPFPKNKMSFLSKYTSRIGNNGRFTNKPEGFLNNQYKGGVVPIVRNWADKSRHEAYWPVY